MIGKIKHNLECPWVLDEKYKHLQKLLEVESVIDFINSMYIRSPQRFTPYRTLNRVLGNSTEKTTKIITNLRNTRIPLRAFSPSALYRVRKDMVADLITSAKNRCDENKKLYRM